MKLQVQLFARARDLVGSERVDIDMDEGGDAGMLLRRLMEMHPAHSGFFERCLVARNEEFAAPTTRIEPEDQLAIIPPVSGG